MEVKGSWDNSFLTDPLQIFVIIQIPNDFRPL